MRTLPTLGVCGWLVAAAALPALSALEWIAGGVAQAQQLDPPVGGKPNVLQKEPFDLLQKEPLAPGYENLGDWRYLLTPPASSPPTSRPETSGWLSSYWLAEQKGASRGSASDWQSLYFREGGTSRSRGKGDYWKPGEFDRLIGR